MSDFGIVVIAAACIVALGGYLWLCDRVRQ